MTDRIALDPTEVAAAVVAALVDALGPRLVSVVAHGSWVHGDFEPRRSDVDLLAVLDRDPTAATIAELGPRLDAIFREHPGWVDRIEIGIVTAAAVTDTVSPGRVRNAGTDDTDGDSRQHAVGRLSPGEPLHLVPADLHRALDWDAAHRGRTIVGPTGQVPAVPVEVVRQVLIDTLAQWPDWVEDMHGDGLAYAVLTVCRADAYASTGRPHSKRSGAHWMADRRPDLAAVVAAAEHDWYSVDDDRQLDPGEAETFVRREAAQRSALLRRDRPHG